MKYLSTFLVILFLSSGLSAQDAFSKFLNKYQEEENVTIVNVNKKMMEIMVAEETDDAKLKSMQEIAEKFEKVEIVVVENDGNKAKTVFEAFKGAVDLSNYETILSVNSGDEYVKLVSRMKNNRFQEFIMVVKETNEFVSIRIKGDFTLGELMKVGNVFDMDIGDAFE